MKYVLTVLSLWLALTATAQPVTTPTAPDKVSFADLTVRFDPDARRIIQQDINSLMGNRQYWTAKLDRAMLYFPIMETILLSEQIPPDFKYLAVQESSLTPDAVSSSQAVGYWQFKRETAQDYGMMVNDEVDERKNISSSTLAATKYLRRSQGMYNNWLSALFSFYLGTGGIKNLVPPDWANSHDITLDASTDRYMLRFFAHKLAMEYGMRTYQSVNTFSLVEYADGAGKTIDEIGTELNVNPADIRSYNRWLLIDHVPTNKPYIVIIPTPNGQINDMRQRIARSANKPLRSVITDDIGFPVLKRVSSASASANGAVLYEINELPGIQAQAGDNAASLAKKGRISFSSFLRYNDLREEDALIPGEVYYLAKKRRKAMVPYHTARRNETTRSVSQRYGLRLKKLLRYNRMDRSEELQTGRVLWLTERRPARKPVEINTAPTPPVYDNSPSTPSTRPVVVRTDAAGNAIPRNASERKLYQPKLLGSATPSGERVAETSPAPARPTTSAPATSMASSTISPTTASPSATNPATNPPTTPPASQPAAQPTPTVTTAVTPDRANPGQTIEVPVAVPRDAGSPQRTIIVRSEGESVRENTTPARSVPGSGVYPETPDPGAATASTQTSKPAITPAPTPVKQPQTQQVAERVPTPVKQPQSQQTAERTPLPRDKSVTIPPLPPMMRTDEATTPAEPSKGRTMKHTVEAGQTYYSLSRYYGVRVGDLLSANNLTLDDKLAVGQTLVVPGVPLGYPTGQPTSTPAAVPAGSTQSGSTPSGSPIPPTTVAPPAAAPAYHVVAKGETLYRISKTYNVTVDQLIQWNDLPGSDVKEGQKLKVTQ